ncbi:MAG: hypothetical protein V3U37_03475 [Nitrospinaceae bacterium]
MPEKFAVKVSKSFLKSPDELPPEKALEIAGKLKILEIAPLPAGKTRIKKLKGFSPPLYRLRTGDKRVLYRISGKEVILLKVIDRRELERELKKLL